MDMSSMYRYPNQMNFKLSKEEATARYAKVLQLLYNKS